MEADGFIRLDYSVSCQWAWAGLALETPPAPHLPDGPGGSWQEGPPLPRSACPCGQGQAAGQRGSCALGAGATAMVFLVLVQPIPRTLDPGRQGL